MKLSPKERRFVSEYLKDQNAKQAAIRAGYSKKWAESVGPRLSRKVQVKAAIDTELAKIQEKAGVTQERILTALLTIAESDFRKVFDEKGKVRPLQEIPNDIALAVSSIDVEEVFDGFGGSRVQTGEMKKVRFWDKTKALELLGKHLKMFVDRVEGSGPNGGPIPVKGSPIDFSGLTTTELKKLAGMHDAPRK